MILKGIYYLVIPFSEIDFWLNSIKDSELKVRGVPLCCGCCASQLSGCFEQQKHILAAFLVSPWQEAFVISYESNNFIANRTLLSNHTLSCLTFNYFFCST